MSSCPRILILGAGPTGLGAAWRLAQLKHPTWHLLEAGQGAGGLAASVRDDHGFTWDLGGHVLFSHYDLFDAVMDDLLAKEEWVPHIREAWVYMDRRFIPYPFQKNLWLLPWRKFASCLMGLWSAKGFPNAGVAQNFEEWILANYGKAIADVFLLPYNQKVWAYPPRTMGAGWIRERVATVGFGQALQSWLTRRVETGWGPNSVFRYPRSGGTGAIWQALAKKLPAERLHWNQRVTQMDVSSKQVITADGTRFDYDVVISTLPLDELIRDILPWPELRSLSAAFKYSSTHVVGVGVEGSLPKELATKCWMYFPEAQLPFYRVTVFSNYSPLNVPDASRHWSLLCEVSESPEKSVHAATIAEDVLRALRRTTFFPSEASVVSLWHRRLEHGYPTPFLNRDEVLQKIDDRLKAAGIWSRGRFGGWKYEVSNQDHSFMQGVEAADHLLQGKPENTYYKPDVTNQSRQGR